MVLEKCSKAQKSWTNGGVLEACCRNKLKTDYKYVQNYKLSNVARDILDYQKIIRDHDWQRGTGHQDGITCHLII